MELKQSEIVKFYKDQTVFITGGTGFLGKLLIEKILRVCDVRRIYILVRPKKEKSTQERFKNLFDFPCFERLKSERDCFLNKISLIDGDCSKSNLGLTPEDQETLKKEVTCFIHAAANVKFDQSLRTAASNSGAVRDALNLAKQMPKLKAFVFVSTAYSNCIHPYIGEKFYDPPMTADELFTLLEETSDELLEEMTPRLLEPYPNTYIFTKCIAEHIIKKEAEGLPVTIVRPAIVTSTIEEPLPGWIDNFNGVVGIIVAGGLGIIRCYRANLNAIGNLVPCDFVSNLVLASSWYVATNKGDLPIFNYIGRKKNPISWGKFISSLENVGRNLVPLNTVWYYCFQVRENYYWHNVCRFFQHTALAYVVDFFLIIARKTPLAVKNYARLDKTVSYVYYFSVRSWFFDSRNVENLWRRMGEVDRKLFNFNFDDMDFNEYIKSIVLGCRIYLLKDPLETVPKAMRKRRIQQIIHYLFLTLLTYLMICCIFSTLRMCFIN